MIALKHDGAGCAFVAVERAAGREHSPPLHIARRERTKRATDLGRGEVCEVPFLECAKPATDPFVVHHDVRVGSAAQSIRYGSSRVRVEMTARERNESSHRL